MATRDITTGVVFSSGWWVSIDVLRMSQPPIAFLADIANISIEQATRELDEWARGAGLMFGVTVDVEGQTYECAS